MALPPTVLRRTNVSGPITGGVPFATEVPDDGVITGLAVWSDAGLTGLQVTCTRIRRDKPRHFPASCDRTRG